MELRPYQQAAVEAVLSAREEGLRRLLYVLPTGTGKTQVFVGIRQRLGGKALVLAHREELLDQAAHRFLQVDPSACPAIEQGNRKAHRWAEVIAASVQTLSRGNRLDWFRPDMIIADEAHHAVSPTHRKTLERFGAFREDGPLVVGCTATPKRLDRLNLQTIFQRVVYTYSVVDAIDDGWLCMIRGYRVKTSTDLSGVKTTAGDYNQAQLEKAVDTDDRTSEIIAHWRDVAADRPTAVFCAGVAHARHMAEAFRSQGVSSEHIEGGMPRDERAAVLSRLRSGETQVICNVDILTEGFDHPPLSCIVMARPTQSWGLYVQCIGRGTRIAPGKEDLIVIDAVDNCQQHKLATVPAILDLPPGLDLQGNSVREAARMMTALGDKVAALETYQPELFEHLTTMLEQVDLLSGALTVPREVREGHCRLAWVRLREGAYHVSCGPGREASLTRDLLGAWTFVMTLREAVRYKGTLGASTTPAGALMLSDKAIRRHWPDAEGLAAQDAHWRTRPASEKQAAMLRRFGVSPEIIRQVDRGAASAIITRMMREKV